MGPADLLLLVMLTALTLYALFGGADFGAGVWEFTTALQSTDEERDHIYRAIGPVWEANHVWLIFAVTILLNAFPPAFAAISRALWLPLLLALAGIVFRGASYVFRSYSRGTKGERRAWEAVFAIASTAAPLFLGAAAGAIASGGLEMTPDGKYAESYDYRKVSSLAIFTGFYAVGLCAFLSAVYLVREANVAQHEQLEKVWRQRALSTGLWMGLLSFGGLGVVHFEAPELETGFLSRAWPLVIVSLFCGIGSLVELWRRNYVRATVASIGAVASVIWGWGIAQYPMILPPGISAHIAKAPDRVLWLMVVVIGLGAVLLLPALGYLMMLFKSEEQIEVE